MWDKSITLHKNKWVPAHFRVLARFYFNFFFKKHLSVLCFVCTDKIKMIQLIFVLT